MDLDETMIFCVNCRTQRVGERDGYYYCAQCGKITWFIPLRFK